AVGLWLDPSPLVRPDWMGLLRAATLRQPLNAADQASNLPGARGRFVEGVAHLLAGQINRAHELLATAAAMSDAPVVVAVLARVLVALTPFGGRLPPAERTLFLDDEIDAMEIPWLTGTWHRLGAVAGDGSMAEAAGRAHGG